MTDKIGEWITPDIHILYGTGRNCTCYDCVVLYGGECATMVLCLFFT